MKKCGGFFLEKCRSLVRGSDDLCEEGGRDEKVTRSEWRGGGDELFFNRIPVQKRNLLFQEKKNFPQGERSATRRGKGERSFGGFAKREKRFNLSLLGGGVKKGALSNFRREAKDSGKRLGAGKRKFKNILEEKTYL